MRHNHRKMDPQLPPLTEEDLSGALRVFQSLERLVEKPGLLTELLPGSARTTSLAKQIHAFRSDRASIFGSDLFAEPAWDILLSLYVAEKEGYRLKISSLCNESGVADTTALRWIERLIGLGLIRRRRDPFDHRSSFVEFEPEGLEKMDRLLEKGWRERFPID